MKPRLNGDRCRCNSCGLYFKSTRAFENHRQGAAEARHCLTIAELSMRGMRPNTAGFWRTPCASPKCLSNLYGSTTASQKGIESLSNVQ
jgi:hypothetical protein